LCPAIVGKYWWRTKVFDVSALREVSTSWGERRLLTPARVDRPGRMPPG
jgi:hypothetical protein